MGVPTLFKWLAKKYPKSIMNCVEEFGLTVDDIYVPPDVSLPNPNGIEFDNFYIDMNGIIHNCSHNEGLDKVPETSKDTFENMFMYVFYKELRVGILIVYLKLFALVNSSTWQ